MAPRSLPRWGAPDGWTPEKMRGRGEGAATGAGAGASSVVMGEPSVADGPRPERPLPVGYHSRAMSRPSPAPSVRAEPLSVAMLGAGTVGRAVAEWLLGQPDRLVTADGA